MFLPSGLPKCHELHYLQMACEKLSKAYRLRQPAANVDEIATHHVGFLKFINDYVRSPAMKARYAGKASAHKAMCKEAGKIAREIEKLAPAVDRAWSPENAEYPWERGNWDEGNGTVLVPCSTPRCRFSGRRAAARSSSSSTRRCATGSRLHRVADLRERHSSRSPESRWGRRRFSRRRAGVVFRSTARRANGNEVGHKSRRGLLSVVGSGARASSMPTVGQAAAAGLKCALVGAHRGRFMSRADCVRRGPAPPPSTPSHRLFRRAPSCGGRSPWPAARVGSAGACARRREARGSPRARH